MCTFPVCFPAVLLAAVVVSKGSGSVPGMRKGYSPLQLWTPERSWSVRLTGAFIPHSSLLLSLAPNIKARGAEAHPDEFRLACAGQQLLEYHSCV